ncbi:MAG: L-aspartate dehydrogenase [Candidatus Nitrosocaldaceae archaeon]|nr:MAG: L-aspartate dehydrogenase [Candidatus Nitrosocaldaceae archaeon]
MKKVALIGCGAIGSEIARAIDNKKVDARLIAIFDVYEERADALIGMLKSKPKRMESFDALLDEDLDIVVEAASQEALKVYASKILRKFDLMAMSIGALLDQEFLDKINEIIKENNRKLYLPTGAIAGIDAIKSVKELINYVEIITTKPPKGLIDAPYIKMKNIDLAIDKAKVIYEGFADEAVKYFPANVNVAATLSLAGIGAKNTRVKIIADPNIKTNKHQIIVKGKFGEFNFVVNNVPSPNNPKTSYLAILSAIECLRGICDDRIRIGT